MPIEIHAKADPAHGDARLGIALVRAGRYDEAVPMLTRANARYGWERIKIALALAHYHKGKVESARRLMGEISPRYRQLNPLEPAGTPWHWALEVQFLYRDAEAVIQSERYREMSNLLNKRQLAEAGHALEKLLQPGPRHMSDWVARGLYHLELGQWDKATHDYGEAIRRGANSLEEHWRVYALLCHLAGQRDEYRRVCAQVLERFGKTEHPWTAFLVVAACQHALEQDDRDRLLLIVEKDPKQVGLRGQLLYRQGQFEAAARRLEEVVKTPKWINSQFDKLFLAMTYQRLGRGEEARTLLAEASSWTAQHAASIAWVAVRQELKMLRDEAEELILRKPAAPGP